MTRIVSSSANNPVLLDAGPLGALATLLEHSRVQMVLRYAHPVEEHKINAIRRLEVFNAERETTAFEAGIVLN